MFDTNPIGSCFSRTGCAVMVKVITDSCADIPQEEAKRWDITVVPVYLRFGDKVYRDGVDIDSHEFYRKLVTEPVHPSTAAPSPGDFAKAYEEAARETDEIISIHVTSRHSAVYDVAKAGREIVKKGRCRIEVIDSKGVTMWQGLVAIAAAQAAKAGYGLDQVLEKVGETIKQMRALALLDTVVYAVKGGRLGRAASAMDSLLPLKLLLTLRDGRICPAGLVRTRKKGIDRLLEFTRSALRIEDLAIVHSATSDDAQRLADHIRSFFPDVVARIVELGPALGVHAGPGALVTVLREAK